MKKFSKELKIGVSVLITLLILIFGIDYLKGINLFKASNYYYASYTNVAGLAQSAPITVNGYKVGLVREIEYEYDNPGHVKVELSLDKKLKIPVGTEAVLVTDMLGTSSIELKMGSENNFHNVGDKLIGKNAAGLMENVTQDLMPTIGAILPKVDSLLTAATTIATDSALLSSVKRLDNIMANLERSTSQLARVMTAAPTIVNEAGATMSNVKEISSKLVSISDDMAVMSQQLRNSPFDSTLNNVNKISASLAEITQTLNSNQSSLGLLINDPAVYNNLNNAVESLDALLKDVKANPKRYISIKLL